MGKAVFLGMSAAFFTAYALIANALVIPNERITPISTQTSDCEDVTILLPGDPCYTEEASGIPIIGPLLAGLSNTISVAASLFSGFMQLITFQANGLYAASLITALIFYPLGFINAFIIFSAIRGSG